MSITVSHLSKKFNLYSRPLHRLKEWLTLGSRKYHTDFWALRDVNLEIAEGTSVGIIGPNGAGKSTLLKIITGTLFPTEGEVDVQGRVAGLLELGTGFHPEFTGRLNIYLNAKMLGLSDEEIERKMPEIIRFSELGDFIEQPIRTYSSGMVMRLGFSIASCVEPDVLIIDEALSVGDAYFSQKCVRRIREFREQGVTILFVSHDPTAVLTLCDHAVLLEHGAVQRTGTPEEVLDFYNARIAQRSADSRTQILIRDQADGAGIGTQRSGNFRAVITSVEFLNSRGEASEFFISGEKATLVIGVYFLEDVSDPTVGILFRNRLGIEVYGVNTKGMKKALGAYKKGDHAEVRFDMTLDLGPDDYSLTVAVHLDETHLVTSFDWIDKACRLRVLPPVEYSFYGLARLMPVITATAKPAASDAMDLTAIFRPILGECPKSLSADSICDRFFLEGWQDTAAGNGQTRLLTSPARFVFTPTGNAIVMHLGEELPAGRLEEPILEWIGGSIRGKIEKADLLFELPQEFIGKTQSFRLTIPSGAPIHVVSIESLEK